LFKNALAFRTIPLPAGMPSMNAANPPTVAVVICTVDRLAALDKCLDSLARQTHPPREIVVALGGVSEVVEKSRDRHPGLPIRTVLCGGSKISASRNVGLAACSASLILFVDDDAEAEHDRTEEIMSCFASNPENWAVGGDVVDSRGKERVLEFSHGIVSVALAPFAEQTRGRALLDVVGAETQSALRGACAAGPPGSSCPSGRRCLYASQSARIPDTITAGGSVADRYG
jgi:GT2 family glycosyltransferase